MEYQNLTHLVYITSHKQIGVYSISNLNIDDIYFKGYCIQKNRVITLRADRIIKQFDDLALAENYAQNIPQDVFYLFDTLLNQQRKEKITPIYKIGLCFTGFKKAKKEELIKLATENDLRVVENVSGAVDFLIFDKESKTVGPTKLAKAEKLGIKIINDEEFLYMLETGVVPD